MFRILFIPIKSAAHVLNQYFIPKPEPPKAAMHSIPYVCDPYFIMIAPSGLITE